MADRAIHTLADISRQSSGQSDLDGYKVPKSVIAAGELPRTSTGKVQKNVVRDQYAGHYQ